MIQVILLEKICIQFNNVVEIVTSSEEFELYTRSENSIKWSDGRIVYLRIDDVEYCYDTKGNLICLKTDDYVVIFDILADRTYEDYEEVIYIYLDLVVHLL